MGSQPLMSRRDYGEKSEKDAFVIDRPTDSPQTVGMPDEKSAIDPKVVEVIKSNDSLEKALLEIAEKSHGSPAVMSRVVQGIYETLRTTDAAKFDKPAPIRTMWASLDDIANRIESQGLVEEAELLDVISNTLQASDRA